MRFVLLSLAITAAAAPAADRVPAATPAGEEVTCIPIAGIRESRVRSDDVIDFVMRNRKVYRVTLPNGCPGLGSERRFSYTTSLSRLCAQDVVTVFSTAPVQRGASCGLAPFRPVTLVARR
ncbi:hypothetical protein [Sphingomonas rubra]|uniref:Uncharacterized protein n=1 Tax=Sphingomonas rubra TaxID=634430 RepID=A0A1I5UB15_9SPHN|nr:hypothetical protein [Sphingomonas rubra]SFP92480.1 hypothetical protein SAMN04488241_11131 [Sphingomonas rubra]